MKIIFWNIRGIGNNESRIALRDMYHSNNPSLVFIVEPMVMYASIPNWFWNNIRVTKYCVNTGMVLLARLYWEHSQTTTLCCSTWIFQLFVRLPLLNSLKLGHLMMNVVPWFCHHGKSRLLDQVCTSFNPSFSMLRMPSGFGINWFLVTFRDK